MFLKILLVSMLVGTVNAATPCDPCKAFHEKIRDLLHAKTSYKQKGMTPALREKLATKGVIKSSIQFDEESSGDTAPLGGFMPNARPPIRNYAVREGHPQLSTILAFLHSPLAAKCGAVSLYTRISGPFSGKEILPRTTTLSP